jgi:hypothetical protein
MKYFLTILIYFLMNSPSISKNEYHLEWSFEEKSLFLNYVPLNEDSTMIHFSCSREGIKIENIKFKLDIKSIIRAIKQNNPLTVTLVAIHRDISEELFDANIALEWSEFHDQFLALHLGSASIDLQKIANADSLRLSGNVINMKLPEANFHVNAAAWVEACKF